MKKAKIKQADTFYLHQVVEEAKKAYPGLDKKAAIEKYADVLVKVNGYAKDINRVEAAYFKWNLLVLLLNADGSYAVWQKEKNLYSQPFINN